MAYQPPTSITFLSEQTMTYQPPDNTTFLSEQISHQQPTNNSFLSKQISTSHTIHQLPAKRTDCR
jgi:cell division protein FtsL